MLNFKKLLLPSLLMSFSTFTFILPLALWSNVDPANANESQREAVKTCMDLRKLIKNLDFGSPTRNNLESSYANLRCHRYLHNKADGRNCEEFLKVINNPNIGATYMIVELYRKGCIIPLDEDGE
jgi:hypothetical protein